MAPAGSPPPAGAVALVTGGAGGIGTAVCRALADRGMRVAVAYRRSERPAAEVVQAIRARGGQAEALQADLAESEQVRRLVSATADLWGRLDVLVNAAGLYDPCPVEELDEARWRRMLDVHLTAAFLCIRAALPWLERSSQAAIVNVASTSAFTGGTSGAHYAAAKAGLIGLTRALARELAPRGIRVNAVVPGKIATAMLRAAPGAGSESPSTLREMVPLGRAGTPEEVARAVAFLAMPDASFTTGAILHVSGGYGLGGW